jgi:LAO/AO transport system ATPase
VLDGLVRGAVGGDRRCIARLISMVEDGGRPLRAVMDALHPHTGDAYSVGITGAPGAGKSTLTERLVRRARAVGKDVGVLAVDPTSPFSGGALLGDRVRMQNHATDPGVFIRSMATRGHLGGIALATPEAVRVLDAAGKDVVFIETVGVGQAEVEISDACDTTLVVLNPGWGDAVQAAKAGLLEIADVFVVNKADREGTRETVRELRQMLAMAEAGAMAFGVRLFAGPQLIALTVLAPATLGGSVWDLVFSPYEDGRWLFVADGSNRRVWILERETMAVAGSFGRGGRQAGQFDWVHNVAADSAGNLYTAEVNTGKRVQKFSRVE